MEELRAKTRAEYARDYLSDKLVDRDTNFGMNEAYRMALADMVEYIDLPTTANKKQECDHDVLSEGNTLNPILRPISRIKDGKLNPTAQCSVCGKEIEIIFTKS